ncbi:MAG: hypothetical protein M1824_000036 [Vezdaea acicularis]|nr:MAG: hypothetical protein M1824_000036 [Vezdaea acicularis]
MASGGSLRLSSALLLLVLFLALWPDLIAASVSFDQCGADFVAAVNSGNSTALKYIYKKRPDGLRPGHTPPLLITTEGCKAFCGSGPQIYSWSTASDTITTWVLPICGGLILQAPFESTQVFSTLLVLCRWVGNPVATLTISFWNMKITKKCSLIVDMSVPRHELPGYHKRGLWKQLKGEGRRILDESITGRRPGESKEWPDIRGMTPEEMEEVNAFAELRDSLYILCVLNQYNFQHHRPEAVKFLLQFALFSRNDFMIARRRKLGASLRRGRKHGVVQVLVSLFWFLVALVLSIQKAFGQIGDESTAHNLALGLLVSWLPVLISASLVDQSPTHSDHTKEQLQKFLDQADDICPEPSQRSNAILTDFCGQARKKWHYGIAYSLLTDLQFNLGSRERGLLKYYQNGSMANPKNKPGFPLWIFAPTEFWQILLAFGIVGASTMGAVVISYNTPTVGLGCRSGGYMIFGILSGTAFIFELVGWTATRPNELHSSPRRRRAFYALRGFLVILEVSNTCWLTYVIIAQTFGIYNSCACKSSTWAGRGGYSDFSNTAVYREDYMISVFWIAGTALGLVPLLAMLAVVYQWCVQSFLTTEDYEKAMRGLRRVRAWRNIFHFNTVQSVIQAVPDKARSKVLGAKYRGILWRR